MQANTIIEDGNPLPTVYPHLYEAFGRWYERGFTQCLRDLQTYRPLLEEYAARAGRPNVLRLLSLERRADVTDPYKPPTGLSDDVAFVRASRAAGGLTQGTLVLCPWLQHRAQIMFDVGLHDVTVLQKVGDYKLGDGLNAQRVPPHLFLCSLSMSQLLTSTSTFSSASYWTERPRRWKGPRLPRRRCCKTARKWPRTGTARKHQNHSCSCGSIEIFSCLLFCLFSCTARQNPDPSKKGVLLYDMSRTTVKFAVRFTHLLRCLTFRCLTFLCEHPCMPVLAQEY